MNKDNIFQKFKEDENTRNKFILWVVISIGLIAIFSNLSGINNKIKEPLVDKEQRSIDNIYAKYEELKRQGKIIEDDDVKVSDSYGDNKIDTDGDGISDYDEQNIFETSVYLKDSDGDGIDDYSEIKNGTNPNCATGKKCDEVGNVVAVPDGQVVTDVAEINGIDINSLDISKIRERLKEIAPSSVKATVDAMTDEQVKTVFATLYKESMNLEEKEKEEDLSYIIELKEVLPIFTSTQISKMENMTEEEIKNLLIDTGIVDSLLLSKFKNGELKNTVLGK